MTVAAKTSLLSALAVAIAALMQCAEDCGDTQYNVENGMIRLSDFSSENIRDLNCSWTYSAPSGRKLLVKVDNVHLPPLELRTSQLQLYVDDTFYDIPRNCVKCLREMVGGKVLRVVFTSTAASSHVVNGSDSWNDSIGAFQLRYKSFDPLRCSKPEQIENGFVVGKGKKLGQTVFYHCDPPYDLIGQSSLTCATSAESPVPDWNGKPPKCVIQDCGEEPVVKRTSPGAIASPSFTNEMSTPCIWLVIAQPTQQIKVSISNLRFPKRLEQSFPDNVTRLSLLDGDSGTYIVNLTDTSSSGPLNFTTLTNKLTVELTLNEGANWKDDAGFYIDFSFVSSSCPEPTSPENGEVIAHSYELDSVVAYRCSHGYVLVGQLQAECLWNGQWSHPTPSCEPLNVHLPSFLAASNSSDTVTAKLSDLADVAEGAKLPKNGKKKATESVFSKDGLDGAEPQEKAAVQIAKPTVAKKEQGNGPKSEPHLLQVVPPKSNGKKPPEDKVDNTTKTQTAILPTLDTGYQEQPSRGFFDLDETMVYIIAGVSGPVVLLVIIVIVVTVYRRKYPVRMRFGRKFSTFENPMYVTKDAHHPRELTRLTT